MFLVSLIEGVKNEQLKSFLFRVYNTFKSVILPIVIPLVFIELQNNPDNVSCLLEGSFWMKVLYAVVVALVGSALAGLDKLTRTK